MKITAKIRLQHCTTNTRKAFVGKLRREHGIAKGPVVPYEVEGASWSRIRAILKNNDVMGHSMVTADTVDSWVRDIGTAQERLAAVRAVRIRGVVELHPLKDLTI